MRHDLPGFDVSYVVVGVSHFDESQTYCKLRNKIMDDSMDKLGDYPLKLHWIVSTRASASLSRNRISHSLCQDRQRIHKTSSSRDTNDESRFVSPKVDSSWSAIVLTQPALRRITYTRIMLLVFCYLIPFTTSTPLFPLHSLSLQIE